MKKLWETTAALDSFVERYTVGDDPQLDRRLVKYECLGSAAHAEGLVKAGLLSKKDLKQIKSALKTILSDGSFAVSQAQEDIHTAVEQALTAALGELGKKVHAGRSRNDQVQVDLRLLIKDRLLALESGCADAAAAWTLFAAAHARAPMPGYTHLQRGMPTTVGHWAASHAEALLENARSLRAAFDEADACPLGAAAGFGATLPLDRPLVARLLGFSRVQRNTLRVQSARPRVEAAAVAACALLARDIGTLAWDLSLFTTAEFGFLTLDRSFTTGSSIMPQKKNPDVVELTRARAALFPGWVSQLLALGQLPSGYHRDYQLGKAVLVAALDAAGAMAEAARRLPGALTVNEDRCRAAVTRDMLATHRALALAAAGTPFREAYRAVADEARSSDAASQPAGEYELPSYPGAPGEPGLAALAAEAKAAAASAAKVRAGLEQAWAALLG